jgi:arabinose-5-phosphate isomerase
MSAVLKKLELMPHDLSHEKADIAAGRAVLAKEIEGLQALSDALDGKFSAFVDLLYQAKGKVIVSGMGKSGHIARKIAATLASTGTPAFFIHPGEASHGDLGMLSKDDVVILLSNSGETAELRDIMNFTRRFGIPLVGMARRKSSALVEAADIGIVLPEIPEASPVGAPTTSTTMMLALGDAVAMALLERKGFTKADFGDLHPGGKLGQAFTKVENLMHSGKELPLVSESTVMSEVLLEITSKRFGCTGVVDAKGVLIGIITDGDLRRHMGKDLLTTAASDVMTKNPRTVSSHALASLALNIMQEKTITSLLVVDEKNTPQGILHIHDILRAGVI